MIQQFHQQFIQQSPSYANWHKKPSHTIVHFLIIIVIASLFVAYISFNLNIAAYNHFAYNIVDATDALRGFIWYSYGELLTRGEIAPPKKILEVSLVYDIAEQSVLNITNVRVFNGYAPKYEIPKQGYALEVLDKDSNVIEKLLFEVPNEVADPYRLLSNVDFILTLDYSSSAKTLRALTPEGIVIASRDLVNVQFIENQPNFNVLRFINKPSSLLPENATAVLLAPEFSKTLKIVIIGDKYPLTLDGIDKFKNDLDGFAMDFISIQPFLSRRKQISIQPLFNETDLRCKQFIINDTTDCLALAVQKVNNAGLSYDKIAIMVNDTRVVGPAGRSNLNSTCCAAIYSESPNVFSHEMGHLLGGLIDEYKLYTSDGIINKTTQENCYAGLPPNPAWGKFVSCMDYALGCSYPNWYRPYQGSIMLSPFLNNYNFFNAPSQIILKGKIDFFASSYINNNKFDIEISSPVDQSTVGRVVEVDVDTSSFRLSEIIRVNFYIDDYFVKTLYEPLELKYVWYTPMPIPCGGGRPLKGIHTIKVVAYDAAENSVSDSVTVNVAY